MIEEECCIVSVDKGYPRLAKGIKGACPGMIGASMFNGCKPHIVAHFTEDGNPTGKFIFAGCDDNLEEVPFTYCPWCGRKILIGL